MVKDHFSSVAAKDVECRPSYPAALAIWLAELERLWGPSTRLVAWPIHLLVGGKA